MYSEQLQAGPPSYVVVGTGDESDCVELWSLSRLPFEPTGEVGEMRVELANKLSLLRCASDQLLHGIYASVLKDACDVENILFYNVGLGPFARSSPRGLRFERMFQDPPPAPRSLSNSALHYHCYCPADVKGDFQHWSRGRILARWQLVLNSPATLQNASRAWWLLKSQLGKLQIGTDSELGWFGLSIQIRAHRRYRFNAPALIKPLFDGVISAFHSYNGKRIDSVAAVLSRQLNLPADEVARDLLSSDMAVLGARQLLWPWRDSVQWNPADERCVAGELLLNQWQDTRIAMLGELFEATVD
jgi:hypothetical protein